jgi:hypothetical protein
MKINYNHCLPERREAMDYVINKNNMHVSNEIDKVIENILEGELDEISNKNLIKLLLTLKKELIITTG